MSKEKRDKPPCPFDFAVTLQPPWRPQTKKTAIRHTHRHFSTLKKNPPADLKRPDRWLLLTNTTVNTFQQAQQVIAW